VEGRQGHVGGWSQPESQDQGAGDDVRCKLEWCGYVVSICCCSFIIPYRTIGPGMMLWPCTMVWEQPPSFPFSLPGTM
jgi:hypothetical protein